MSYSVVRDVFENRRSVYALNNDLPVSHAEVEKMVEHVLLHTPSAFHSQSTRLVLLFGGEHLKFWQFVEDALKAIVPAEQFEPTQARLDMFKAGAGTVLFYEDQAPVKALQEQFPTYADNFPTWSEHANAMHQYALWTAFAAAGIGANLQHYNPLPDAAAAQEWNIPADWTLRAQMVFGGIAKAADEKTFQPVDTRLKVFGA